jgi:hypothetical protein
MRRSQAFEPAFTIGDLPFGIKIFFEMEQVVENDCVVANSAYVYQPFKFFLLASNHVTLSIFIGYVPAVEEIGFVFVPQALYEVCRRINGASAYTHLAFIDHQNYKKVIQQIAIAYHTSLVRGPLRYELLYLLPDNIRFSR